MQLGIPVRGGCLAMRILTLPNGLEPVFRDLAAMLLIGTIGWILIRGANTIEAMVKGRFSGHGSTIEAKRAQTRVSVLNRLAVTVIVIVTAGAMLMVFERVRANGASLLASAGIAGVVIGFSSQRLLANLLAGFQIAISEPVRIGDSVIVEGEFGTIEEITLTYVVVRCWDLRRLVLPISYFIERPFQNWSRSSTELLGVVMLYLDYMAPIETIRQALKDIVSRSTLWDGRVVGLQVTDAREQVIEVRCLVSATDSGKTFDLRCEVREQLIAFIRTFCPEALPRVRGTIHGPEAVIPEQDEPDPARRARSLTKSATAHKPKTAT
jgi:small-conductance mechanosensitive channel